MKWLALLALAACSGPKATPTPVPQPGSGTAVVVPVDAPAASQEETLAAIQKAMNELDEAAQQCWAIAATDRFDVEGDIEVMVDISATSAKTQIVRDTSRNPKLLGCLGDLLAKYRWAPPLHGQTIQLPFKFRSPGPQNTIDRNHVAWNGQGKTSVAVLLDENNAANAAASMIEIALQNGGATGMRIADRAELWYFLGPATVEAAKRTTAVAAGDMMFVAANVARDVQATNGDVHAVIVIVPGGREGSARAGALQTRELGAAKSTGVPTFFPAAKAKKFGPATFLAEKLPLVYGGIIELGAGTTVAEHVHAKETELLYILAGAGSMTVGTTKLAVTPTTVVQIPPNTKHSFTASSDVRAVQFYTPAGPEQRFKAKP